MPSPEPDAAHIAARAEADLCDVHLELMALVDLLGIEPDDHPVDMVRRIRETVERRQKEALLDPATRTQARNLRALAQRLAGALDSLTYAEPGWSDRYLNSMYELAELALDEAPKGWASRHARAKENER